MSNTVRIWFFTCLCFCSTVVSAQNVSEHTRRRQEIEREIAAIDKQLDSNQAQQKATLLNLSLLQQKIASRKELLAQIEDQVLQTNDSIKKKENEIQLLKIEYGELEFLYLQIVYKAYTHRNRQIWAAYLFASDNLKQAYRRWQYFKSFSRYANQKAAELKELNLKLEEEMMAIKTLQSEVLALRTDRQEELTTLNTEERQSKQLITTMSRQEQTLKKQLQQKQKDLDKINKEITRIMADAEKTRKAANVKEQEIDRALAANFEQNKGKLPWPLSQGVVVESFGQHNHPVLKGIKLPFNNGIGISGNRGDEVRAVFQGEVKQIVLIPGYNQCVLIQHGSYYTFYCKLGSVKVKTGDTVATGDVLGTLAEIDGTNSLHFELYKGTERQNPELWLRKK